jgi:transcriptional regulator NrdR family protein
MTSTPPQSPAGIVCPGCGCADFRRCYTRQIPGGTRRVRECRHCGRRIVTVERLTPSPPVPLR